MWLRSPGGVVDGADGLGAAVALSCLWQGIMSSCQAEIQTEVARMLTIGGLIRQSDGLRLLTDEGDDRAVVGVWPAHGAGPPPEWRGGWTDLLAVVDGPLDTDRCTGLMAELARGGAAGVVTVVPAVDVLLSAAQHYRLPLVEALECTARDLDRLVLDAWSVGAGRTARAATAEAERLRRLVDLACGQENPDALRQWLGTAIAGRAYLIAPGDPLPAVRDGLVLPAARVAAVSAGTPNSDSEAAGGWSLHLYGLGRHRPRTVLAVARRGAWPPWAIQAATRAQRVLEMWEAQHTAGDAGSAHMRAAVMDLLRDGHLGTARRAARPLGLSPAALRAGTIQVCALDVRAGRLVGLAADLQRQLGDRALVAPGADGRVEVLHGDDDGVRDVLRSLLGRDPTLYLGASRPADAEDSIPDAFREASQALAAAVDTPGRWVDYTPVRSLVSAISGAPAHQWEQALMAPLEAWPPDRRAVYAQTARLALAYGTVAATSRAPKAAAGDCGVSRDTVRKRGRAVAEAVGLDFWAEGDRIVLDLALRIRDMRLRTPAYSGPPVTLGDLLGTEEVASWAREHLARIGAGGLIDVLAAWLECGMSVERTAAGLGMDVKTLRARLRRAEQLGECTLITAGSAGEIPQGVHDLLVAAYVTGMPCAPPVLLPRHLGR